MGDVVFSGVWRDLVGQTAAVETLDRAVRDEAAMTHAWLFTGPPGSGRSMAARAFAAALQCPDHGCGECRECRTAMAGSHADVKVVSIEGLSIGVDFIRELVLEAQVRPSVGAWRCIVIEDADRMTEKAADALLKTLEEPPPRTVWMLCAPSLEDVIITVRSRSRHVRLRTPPVAAVAELLHRRDGIDPSMALYAARVAQSHVGMAKRLATDEGARIRRRDTISLASKIVGVSDAIAAAADLHQIAAEESEASLSERDAREKTRFLETSGADPNARTQPPHIRAALAQLERDQKSRAKRHLRDIVDRALIDLASIYRDALVVALGADQVGVEVVNLDAMDRIRALAGALGPDRLLGALDAISEARERITLNVTPQLAMESMALRLRVPRDLGV